MKFYIATVKKKHQHSYRVYHVGEKRMVKIPKPWTLGTRNTEKAAKEYKQGRWIPEHFDPGKHKMREITRKQAEFHALVQEWPRLPDKFAEMGIKIIKGSRRGL